MVDGFAKLTISKINVDDKIINAQIWDTGRSSSWRSNSSSTLSSHESMREEKEWRRTLACKLFEERHNSRGGENDSSNNRQETMNNKNNNKIMMMNNKNVGIKISKEEKEDDEDEEDDEDDEPEMSHGPLCCLQALKLKADTLRFVEGVEEDGSGDKCNRYRLLTG